MVSMLPFYPDDPSLNHAEAFTFSDKFVLESNEKHWPIIKRYIEGPLFHDNFLFV